MRMEICMILVVAAGLAGCGRGGAAAGEAAGGEARRVSAQTVEAKPHVATEEVVGTVRAKLRSVIEAKLSGRVERMAVVPGQQVKAGEVLIALDGREVQSRLDQARAVLEESDKELSRTTQLLAKRVITQAEFDKVQSSNRVARAAVSEAETNLGYLTIRAPFAGVITRKLADVGDLAAPGRALLEMENPDALRFEGDVPEAIIGEVKGGEKLVVRSGGVAVTGTVGEIAPVADLQSRTFLVKLDLPAAAGLRSGQFGRVSVPVSETTVLRVPQSAVLTRGQMELVFVVQSGRAQLRIVKTGKRIGDEIEIVSGLDSREQVVTTKAGELLDGQRVEVENK